MGLTNRLTTRFGSSQPVRWKRTGSLTPGDSPIVTIREVDGKACRREREREIRQQRRRPVRRSARRSAAIPKPISFSLSLFLSLGGRRARVAIGTERARYHNCGRSHLETLSPGGRRSRRQRGDRRSRNARYQPLVWPAVSPSGCDTRIKEYGWDSSVMAVGGP